MILQKNESYVIRLAFKDGHFYWFHQTSDGRTAGVHKIGFILNWLLKKVMKIKWS